MAEVLSQSLNAPNQDKAIMAKVIRVMMLYGGKVGGLQGYGVTYKLRGNKHHHAEVFAKDEIDAYRKGNGIIQRELEKLTNVRN